MDKFKFPALLILLVATLVICTDHHLTGGFGLFSRIVAWGALALFAGFVGYAFYKEAVSK